MPETSLGPWIGFTLFVLAMLALDLGVFHRKAHAVSMREATIWSLVWVTLSLLFNAGLYFFRGPDAAVQFLTGYLIEKSLSVDNIFVFALLFGYFAVPRDVPAPGALLGHPRRPGDAGGVHPRGIGPHCLVPLDPLHLRRLPHLHRGSRWRCSGRWRSTRSTIRCSIWCGA